MEKFRFVRDLDGPCEPLLPTGPKKPGESTASLYALRASLWLDPCKALISRPVHSHPTKEYHSNVPNRFLEIMESHGSQPKENKQKLFILSLVYSKASLCLGKYSKADRRVRKLYSGRKGRLQVCPNRRPSSWGGWRWAT